MNKTSHTEQMGTCDRHQLASDLEIGCACGPVAKCAKHASASKVEQPTRRQIVFNWLMRDSTDKHDGWWGTAEEVELIDELLAALDAHHMENYEKDDTNSR